MASETTTHQKHLLTQLNTLVSSINKADALLKSGQSTLANTQLLSVIARTLVMQLAERHELEGRLNLFHPGHEGPA
jgi:hypothetical protein